MKSLLVSLGLAVVVGLYVSQHAPHVEDTRKALTGHTVVPIQDNAVIYDGATPETVNSLVKLVQRNGYRCDTISSVLIGFSAHGYYTIGCNHTAYNYVIEDKGGQWTVTVQ